MAQAALKSFTRRSNGRAALALAGDWAMVAAAVLLAERLGHPLATALAILASATRMAGLAELAHEAQHYNLFARRSWNDRLDLFYAVPFAYRVRWIRASHLNGHHAKHAEERLRPDYSYDYFRLDVARLNEPRYMRWVCFVRPLLGLHGWLLLKERLDEANLHRRDPSALLGFLALAGAVAALAGPRIVLVYWLVPYVVVYPILDFWNDMMSHFKAVESGSRDARGWLVRLLISPHNFLAYHNLHHAHPSVPWFRMAEAQGALMAGRTLTTSHGLVQAFGQMIRPVERPAVAA